MMYFKNLQTNKKLNLIQKRKTFFSLYSENNGTIYECRYIVAAARH